jgi:DNA-binding protein H-NS
MKVNFGKLSDSELKQMISAAEKALSQKELVRRKDVISQLRELAASIGVTVEIIEGPRKTSNRKGSKVPVKFRNPKNAEQKWSGRGLQPKWLKALLAQGHKLSEFEVK